VGSLGDLIGGRRAVAEQLEIDPRLVFRQPQLAQVGNHIRGGGAYCCHTCRHGSPRSLVLPPTLSGSARACQPPAGLTTMQLRHSDAAIAATPALGYVARR